MLILHNNKIAKSIKKRMLREVKSSKFNSLKDVYLFSVKKELEKYEYN